MVDCLPSESIVDLGSASVDNVSSGWQSTTVKSFIFVGLKFRGFEFKNEIVDI